jgi:hypothetical protein
MKTTILILIFLSISIQQITGAKLESVKTIGDERDDYTFFSIGSAALSRDKDIYILDTIGLFLAKYDWNGKFIKRIGQKGRGPRDFYMPRSLNYCMDKLYILERGNDRITKIDLDLNTFNYYKIERKDMFYSRFFALKNGTFLGNFSHTRQDDNRLAVVDQEGNVVKSFFDQYPVKLKIDLHKKNGGPKHQLHKMRVAIETLPVFGTDEERKYLLVSFEKPDNPVAFFVYDVEGKPIEKFFYKIDDQKYRISKFYIDASWQDIANPLKSPAKRFIPTVDSLFIHKEQYVVFLSLRDYKKKEQVRSQSFCLVFAPGGELKHRFPIDSNLRVLSISPEGFLMATKSEEEPTRLYIFKLNI